MPGLWTVSADALDDSIDPDLQAHLAPLAAAIAPAMRRDSVVFHDHAGAFAPVIDDPERAHVHLHAAARGERARTTPLAALQPLSGGLFSPNGVALPRVQTSSSRQLDTIGCSEPGSDRILRIAQAGDGNLFVAVRPADGAVAPIDREITLALVSFCLLHVALGNEHAVRLRAGGPRLDGYRGHSLRELAATHEPLAAIAQLLQQQQIPRVVRHALADAMPRRRQLNDRLSRTRSERENAQAQLARAHETMAALRAERARALGATDGREAEAQMRAELRAIQALPQVSWVGVPPRQDSARLLVHLRPMVLGRHLNREPQGLAVLPPLRLSLRLGGSGHLVRIEDPYGSDAPAPHVRSRLPCLGTAEEPLRECLNAGQYAQAVQLMIGFLQTYQRNDAYGAIGRAWPSFDVETGDGNIALLPDPPSGASPAEEAPDADARAPGSAMGGDPAPATDRSEAPSARAIP